MFSSPTPSSDPLPTLFVPHGAPSFALQPGEAGAALAGLARQLPRPRAVLAVSAHWETAQPTLGVALRPETLHDFYGFARALHAIHYPASGAAAWAMEARGLLEESGFAVSLDATRGLDHGAWIPLRLMYPAADLPVFTMSVQPALGPAHHYRLGQALAPLRGEGVLVLGSGNLTHNLAHFAQLRGAATVPDYVPAFQGWVQDALADGDVAAMLDYRARAPGAVEAHPSDEHLLPLYVALGAAGADFVARRVYSGVEHNMLAMDAYAFQSSDDSQLQPNQGVSHV